MISHIQQNPLFLNGLVDGKISKLEKIYSHKYRCFSKLLKIKICNCLITKLVGKQSITNNHLIAGKVNLMIVGGQVVVRAINLLDSKIPNAIKLMGPIHLLGRGSLFSIRQVMEVRSLCTNMNNMNKMRKSQKTVSLRSNNLNLLYLMKINVKVDKGHYQINLCSIKVNSMTKTKNLNCCRRLFARMS